MSKPLSPCDPGNDLSDHREIAPRAPALAGPARTAPMPQAGVDFFGFHLVRELGRGAFARVFLTRQGELADRCVVLKVSADAGPEAHTLAQLWHPNIVPIYSIHSSGAYRAVCMPFFGTTTLADVLRVLGQRREFPTSGHELLSTLAEQHGDPLATLKEGGSPAPPDLPLSLTVPPPATSRAILEMLGGLSYAEAVLWMAGRLADGLAHAHERGIIHRDLKPANVLLTEEGQPMLLDFNLAEDVKLRSANTPRAGGTLPYMAPEQLLAYFEGAGYLDARIDLFSLGVVLYELLTLHHPYPLRSGPLGDALPEMISDRKRPPEPLRRWNRAVTPAVEAIVNRCLAPDPNNRYQSAQELREDIRRHQQHRPLKYAPNTSLVERGRKWSRRHPRLTSSVSVAALAAVALLALGGALFAVSGWLADAQARQTREQFGAELRSAQFYLNARAADPEQVARGAAACREALARYRVLDGTGWWESPEVKLLPADEQGRLRDDIGEALLLLARSALLEAKGAADRSRAEQGLRTALEWNRQAEECFGPQGAVRAVLKQRADLVEALGQEDQAGQLRQQAESVPLRSARDRSLEASEHAAAGRHREAVVLLEEATRQEPRHFWAWFVLGYCCDGLGRDADAIAGYTSCVALRPDFPWSYFNRGLVRLRQKDFPRASADFTEVIRLQNDLAEAYINRAIARQGLGEFTEAIDDLTRALDLGTSHTRVYLMRAQAREKAGDKAGAEKDRAEGLKREPNDEQGWVARGVARLARDPQGALTDFERALECNPRAYAALKNKAYVLAEKLDRPRDAIAVLDQALKVFPDSAPLRGGRAVYRARMGAREGAVEDARECEVLDTGPGMLYQLACVYALTSRTEADDRRESLRLLTAALRKGFDRFDVLDGDPDLKPVRDLPEFRRLIQSARGLAPNSPR